MTFADFLVRLDRPRKVTSGWVARCPSHSPDRSPSLSVCEGERGILLHCFAGCSLDDICDALGLDVRDLFDDTPTSRRSERRPRAARPERPEDVEYRLWSCALGLRLRALAVFDAATDCDTATWTNGDFDRAMRYITRAHDDLRQAETCDDLAFAMRCELIQKRRAAA